MKRLFRLFPIIVVALTLGACGSRTQADDSHPLEKADAVKILQSMGYQNVAVGAIIQGAGGLVNNPSVATVIAIGIRDGKVTKIEQTLTYDKEIGWFYHQFDGNQFGGGETKIRLWTLAGYKEVMPTKP